MNKETGLFDDISYDYRITDTLTFDCECLSKQLLHGINPLYKSRSRGQDHSYCTFLHITGSVIRPEIETKCWSFSGYGGPINEQLFMKNLQQLCTEHGLLFSQVQKIEADTGSDTSRECNFLYRKKRFCRKIRHFSWIYYSFNHH